MFKMRSGKFSKSKETIAKDHLGRLLNETEEKEEESSFSFFVPAALVTV